MRERRNLWLENYQFETVFQSKDKDGKPLKIHLREWWFFSGGGFNKYKGVFYLWGEWKNDLEIARVEKLSDFKKNDYWINMVLSKKEGKIMH